MSSVFLSAAGSLECAVCAILAQYYPPHSTCLRQGGSVVVARCKLHVWGEAVEVWATPFTRRVNTAHYHHSRVLSLLAYSLISLTPLILRRDTWVLGPQCIACSNGALFDASKSSTFTPLGQSTQIRYGSGFVIADLAYETISMGVFKSEKEVWCGHRILLPLFSPNGIYHCLALLTLSPECLHCVKHVTKASSWSDIRHSRSWLSRFDGGAQ